MLGRFLWRNVFPKVASGIRGGGFKQANVTHAGPTSVTIDHVTVNFNNLSNRQKNDGHLSYSASRFSVALYSLLVSFSAR
jgi:hypothetical protein